MTRLADVVAELNSPDPQRRRETVRALARLRAFEAIDVLRQVAENDPDEEARVLAAAAVAFLERAQVEAQQRPPGAAPPPRPTFRRARCAPKRRLWARATSAPASSCWLARW
ncbi:MAG: HEAT repeat domain-containing protein [Deltaproteobacteria bacterium]|nr:HEAT repeat domain-containing protein [Deltaproteobacteria bacterium]